MRPIAIYAATGEIRRLARAQENIKVVKQCQAERQTLLFSATYPEGIARLAEKFMRSPVQIKVQAQSAGPQIEQRFL